MVCTLSCRVEIPFVAQRIGAIIELATIIPVSDIIAFVWGTIVNSIKGKAGHLDEIEITEIRDILKGILID